MAATKWLAVLAFAVLLLSGASGAEEPKGDKREVEKAVRAALEQGTLRGNEVLNARATMTVQGLSTPIQVDGRIELG